MNDFESGLSGRQLMQKYGFSVREIDLTHEMGSQHGNRGRGGNLEQGRGSALHNPMGGFSQIQPYQTGFYPRGSERSSTRNEG